MVSSVCVSLYRVREVIMHISFRRRAPRPRSLRCRRRSGLSSSGCVAPGRGRRQGRLDLGLPTARQDRVSRFGHITATAAAPALGERGHTGCRTCASSARVTGAAVSCCRSSSAAVPALRLGDKDEARRVAALGVGRALISFLEAGADVAPVPQFSGYSWPSSPVPAHSTGYLNARGARRFYLMRSTSYKSAPKLNLTRAGVGVKVGVRVSEIGRASCRERV